MEMKLDREGWEQVYRYLGFLNDVLLIPLFTMLVLELTSLGAGQAKLLGFANLGFCASFLLEWLLGFILANDRWAYFRRPDKLVDLVASIPFGQVFQGLRAVRCLRLARILRLMIRSKRYRGKGAKIIRMITLVTGTVFAGALALTYIEPEASGGLGDAVWWSLVTVSTVGYGDIIPETTAGRVVASVLILFGIGVFGYVAGMASTILDDDEDDLMEAHLNRIEAKLDRLLQARDGEERHPS
jgi:voltage-gated potassium channel